MSDKQNLSYQAGQATGQTKEKASGLMDKAKDAAASAQDSMQHAGQQMKQKAQGAADVVKDKTGLNKNH
ncbi:stress-induced protein KIN2-like [Raphanus sativus]|uniref:Stress-induced protein KIN2-like n=1 Tax=Raphanus sativus TaxID=3726 RepID=A0A6J0JT88_RAPSA|nr:stress-induced protein KIN2-like [Raphanus sativus]XP_056843647.1 stress-induced protein KIN2-like [Raphanus sativus]